MIKDKPDEYVVGYLVYGDEVALITKARPAWQKRRLNGVGGHICEGETPEKAMVREFQEEANVKIPDWRWFATLKFGKDTVHFFAAETVTRHEFSKVSDEPVAWYPMQNVLFRPDIIPHMKFLLPLSWGMDETSLLKKQYE